MSDELSAVAENTETPGKPGILKKIRKLKLTKSTKRLMIAVGLVFCAVFIIVLIVIRWTYHDYKIEVSDSNENTLAYTYYSANGFVLKCASDSASLADDQNVNIWSETYEMTSPKADICDNKIVIYDKGGISVLICDETGIIGSYKTDLQISKAEVSHDGNAAFLLDDGTNAQIDYYDKNGDKIATISTALAIEGYPMDIALSKDGEMLAVSYLSFNGTVPTTKMIFYNFGNPGQIVSDYIISSYTYRNTIIPEVEYMANYSCVAFGTDIIVVYNGSDSVEEVTCLEPEDEIRSTFFCDEWFGYTLTGTINSGFEIVVCNADGKEKTRIDTDFSYTSIEMHDELIVMYSLSEMLVYGISGQQKFSGEINGLIREIHHISDKKYALATIDCYYIIKIV